MPYKEKDKWRAVVTIHGRRHTALLSTKKAAVSWELAKREQLRKQPEGITLLNFCTKYLDYAARFTPKVYQEKHAVVKRILNRWGPDILVDEITPDLAEDYLLEQIKQRSANAANKDRKNLMAMFSKGIKTYGLKNNPFIATEKFPHDREPQYTPPTEDILKLLAVCTREERIFLDCYLQTAARRSEIFRWTWVDDINFEKRQVRLGTRKTRDGSMEYEWLPMSDDLYASLWWLWNNRKFKKSPYVFVDYRPNHPHHGQPFKSRQKFMRGLCKRAGIKPFGFHALRRYVASVLADTHKQSSKTIQRVLRHKNVTTTERYIQNINADLRSTMNLLSESKIHADHTRRQKKGNGENR